MVSWPYYTGSHEPGTPKNNKPDGEQKETFVYWLVWKNISCQFLNNVVAQPRKW